MTTRGPVRQRFVILAGAALLLLVGGWIFFLVASSSGPDRDDSGVGVARVGPNAYLVSCGRGGISAATIRRANSGGDLGAPVWEVEVGSGNQAGSVLPLTAPPPGYELENFEDLSFTEELELTSLRDGQGHGVIDFVLSFRIADIADGSVVGPDGDQLTISSFTQEQRECGPLASLSTGSPASGSG